MKEVILGSLNHYKEGIYKECNGKFYTCTLIKINMERGK